MNILGISESHEAHACILSDGELRAVMAEERLSRVKADSGYPRRAIDAVLETAGIAPEDIDLVAFAGRSDWIWRELCKRVARFSVQDWIRECELYWKPALLEGRRMSLVELVEQFQTPEMLTDPYYPVLQRVKDAAPTEWRAICDAWRQKVVHDHLGIPPGRALSFRHEDCHKAFGYYSAPCRDEPCLVMTIEGGGDDSSATVSVGTPDGIDEKWTSNDVQVGRLYRYVTLLLGMKPGQHEYKVMGLAPYGSEYHGRRSLDLFRTINRVSGARIDKTQQIPDLYYSVRDALEGERFDGIAWAVQTFTDEILAAWVRNNMSHYGIGNVVLSGGVAQNVKAAKVVAELPDLSQLWIGPAPGDGSLGIGAAWLASREHSPDTPIRGLPSVYLGTEYSEASVDQSIGARNCQSRYELIHRPRVDEVAAWIEDGRVLARFAGRMEFGQRALGNRSILADPRRIDSVERINRQVKLRDFWMPFAASMTAEEASRALVNPKGLPCPHMTLAFDLTPAYRGVIPAAVHPADKTTRPQILTRDANGPFHDLLVAIGRRTGIECVLNTSFNLHGEPIVESPDDAISAFERSDLDVLLFDHVAIVRVNGGSRDAAGHARLDFAPRRTG